MPNPDHLPSWQTCDWHQHLPRASATASLPALEPVPAGPTHGRGPRTAKRPPLCPSPPSFLLQPNTTQQLQHSNQSDPARFTNCLPSYFVELSDHPEQH